VGTKTNIYGLRVLPKWSPTGEAGKQSPDDAREVARIGRRGDATTRPLWSGAPGFPAPPPVGARVKPLGGFGASTVEGYFIEHGYLGLELRPDKRPAWHRKQSPEGHVVRLFGREVEPAPPSPRAPVYVAEVQGANGAAAYALGTTADGKRLEVTVDTPGLTSWEALRVADDTLSYGDEEKVALFATREEAREAALAVHWNGQIFRVRAARGKVRDLGTLVPKPAGGWLGCQGEETRR
jgi:hypothetical protein